MHSKGTEANQQQHALQKYELQVKVILLWGLFIYTMYITKILSRLKSEPKVVHLTGAYNSNLLNTDTYMPSADFIEAINPYLTLPDALTKSLQGYLKLPSILALPLTCILPKCPYIRGSLQLPGNMHVASSPS